MTEPVATPPASTPEPAAPATPPSAATTVANTPPAASWRDSITDAQLKADPTIQSFKSVDDLVKSHISAQRMIGADKIVKPNAKWTEKEWNEFYSHAGRPETPDKYNKPQLKEGEQFHEEGFKKFTTFAHKAGFSSKQFDEALDFYNGFVAEAMQAHQAQQKAQADEAIGALQKEWANDYPVKAEMAAKAIKAFGGDELVQEFEKLGIASNPTVLKAFQAIGARMSEDIADGGPVPVGLHTPNSAQAEIQTLMRDAEFQKILNNGAHPLNKDYQAKWTALFDKAYPSGDKK